MVQAGAGIEVRTSQDSRERRRPVDRDDAPLIRQAIDTVLADGSYRNAAQAVAADMAAAPAIAALLASPP